jgi:two-component sensor histidine kinase
VQAAGGILLGVASVGLRQALSPLLGQMGVPFVVFFPGVTAALVFFGGAGGAVALTVCSLGAAFLFLQPYGRLPSTPIGWFGLLTFVVSALTLFWLVAALKGALMRLRTACNQEKLLDAELQHRVKNTLSIVQSIAAQSFRGDADPRVLNLFDERLVALAQAHNLLSEAAWSGVPLRRLVDRTLERFATAEGGIAVVGDDVAVPADQVVSLALCLNELAGAAARDGAFSASSGAVRITWTTRWEPNPHVRVEWIQRGDPVLDLSARDGFGRRLLERGLPCRGSSGPRLEGLPAGVRWRGEFEPA